jgi:hypothetical protein
VYAFVFLIVVVPPGLTRSPWVIAMAAFLFLGGACFAAFPARRRSSAGPRGCGS